MRRITVAFLAFAFVLLPFVGAQAKKGENNRGGSERSEEVRQDDKNREDKGSKGRGTPDDGDNRHPSGKDRSVEPGGSWPQGHSQSDPDGMSNGGADKPGGTGGIDKGDQDGNNGCGNDDDFEDDNNGLCLGQKKKADLETIETTQPVPNDGTTIIGVRTRRTLTTRVVIFEEEANRDSTVVRRAPLVLSAPQPLPAPVFEAQSGAVVPDVVEEAKPAAVSGSSGSSHQSHGLGVLPKTGMAIGAAALLGAAMIAVGRWLRRIGQGAEIPAIAGGAPEADKTMELLKI